MAIKPRGKGEIGFEAVHLAFLVAAAAIIFSLPSMTSYEGLPALAYAAFAALTVSLVIYGLKPLRLEHQDRQGREVAERSRLASAKWPQSVDEDPNCRKFAPPTTSEPATVHHRGVGSFGQHQPTDLQNSSKLNMHRYQ
ncbi:hypothetical protein AB4089_20060 [Arthrobacter sp. 2MCAF15]|uniref:hypothetical protein n=1 Tax=Arthrobacter sp. 2MCAF15 TaxID=3232984 RepID=UPI003F8E6028